MSGRSEALSDVRVRQAINIAINREQICEILGGTNTPLYGLIPPGIPNTATGKDFNEESGQVVVEDVARSPAVVAEAG